jgi:hypothetical protein
LDENPIAKKVVYGLLIVGGIYVAGKFANGMASLVLASVTLPLI